MFINFFSLYSPGLRMLHVTFCGIAGQLITEDQLKSMREHYSELMKELDCDFRLYRFDF